MPVPAGNESGGCCHPSGSPAPPEWLPKHEAKRVVKKNCCISYQTGNATIKSLDLEAGGDGGKFIVCSLRVSYQIIPAGERLPAEVEAVIISDP